MCSASFGFCQLVQGDITKSNDTPVEALFTGFTTCAPYGRSLLTIRPASRARSSAMVLCA